jgi:glycine betaine/proline transport system substrate-binding protein
VKELMLMKKKPLWHRLGLVMALALAALVVIAACDDDDDDVVANGGTVNIAQIPGWPDSVSTSNLWKVLLEDRGYDVVITPLDVAPTFAGLSTGDLDVYTSSWLPGTHGVYMEEFGGTVESLGPWYQPAGLYLTVPAYVDVDSLEELAANADLFNGTITGIEAGAGMMGILADSVMPSYGLDDWTLLESSTPAMLAELDAAIANNQPIVVTLWSPGWWYAEYDLKNLADPQNAWGDPDQLTPIARGGFSDDFPEVARWMGNWSMTDDQYAPLEALIEQMGDGNEEEAVRQWLEENQDLADSWFD